MRIIEKHSLWLRVCHWINVPSLALMVWSGILIYWANDVYPGFFPLWFYRWFKLDHRLAEGMAVHFSVGWIVVLNGIIYLGFFLGTKHWKEVFPNRHSIRTLGPTILHELGIRKERPLAGKFNAAQQFAYSSIIGVIAIETLTGFILYKPVQLSWLTSLFGGYEFARIIHFAGMIFICLFTFIHVLQVIRAGWNNFRAMVAGFEVSLDDKE